MLAAHPDIKALVFESTELPGYANSIRQMTGLPVFDALTMVQSAENSFKMNHTVIDNANKHKQYITDTTRRIQHIKSVMAMVIRHIFEKHNADNMGV